MTRYTRSMTEVAAHSSKGFVQRVITVIVFLGCAVLLLIGASNSPRLAPLKSGLMEISAPVMKIFSEPAQVWGDTKRWIAEIGHLRADNAKLREENDALRRWQAVAMSLQAENDELKRTIGYAPVEHVSYVTSRIVGYSESAIGHTLLIDQGFDDGVRAHQAVISADGLIGRVLEVSPNSSRVLLLSDMNARVPVIGEQSREKAVLAGAGEAMPRMMFMPANSEIKVGERLLTTDDGGVIPPGIVVGQVFSKTGDDVRVQVAADARRVSYVRVVSHDTPLESAPTQPH